MSTKNFCIHPLHLSLFDSARCSGKYHMPSLNRVNHIPGRLIDFNNAIYSKEYGRGVHFYLDDYRFGRFWKEPERYIRILKHFDCVFTPDFSLYLDMPLAMKIWNVYRSRLLGQRMADTGITVIPTVSWAGPETYEFCFDGLPKNGTVTVSTVGIMRNQQAYALFKSGLSAMLAAIRPRNILIYGKLPDFNFGKTTIFNFETTSFDWKKMKKGVNCKENG